jgi:hypothetical protein
LGTDLLDARADRRHFNPPIDEGRNSKEADG